MQFEQQDAGSFNIKSALQERIANLEADVAARKAELGKFDQKSPEYQAELAAVLKKGGELGDLRSQAKQLEGGTQERPSLSMEAINKAKAAGLVRRLETAMQKPSLAVEEPKVILSGALQEQVAQMNYDEQSDTQKVRRDMRAISDADIAAHKAGRNPNQTH